MHSNQIQENRSENGERPKSDHAKMFVFICIYNVFRGSVDHGGVCPCIYIYICKRHVCTISRHIDGFVDVCTCWLAYVSTSHDIQNPILACYHIKRSSAIARVGARRSCDWNGGRS